MKVIDIVECLAQKVIDTIYTDWKHDGHIEVEHSDDFYCNIDGVLYKISVSKVAEMQE